jgi:hypothetical protein
MFMFTSASHGCLGAVSPGPDARECETCDLVINICDMVSHLG